MSSTDRLGSSLSRAATIAPADPAPRTMWSYFITACPEYLGSRSLRGSAQPSLSRSSVCGSRRIVVRCGVVLGEEVFAPVAGELPPHRVDVVGVVLDVVVLHDEGWALNRIVV